MSSEQKEVISSTVPALVPPLKIGKFKASILIVQQSWAILMTDKKLILFPIVSLVMFIIATAIMGVVYFIFVPNEGNAIYYVVLFTYYLLMFFIIHFFQAAMYVNIHARFNGLEVSFSDGMRIATKNIHKILTWSIISATVGVILHILASRTKFMLKFGVLLSATWSILTYFSLPLLIIKQTPIKDSFKDSAIMIRKTWNEAIVINLGVGLFFALIFALSFIGFMSIAFSAITLEPFELILVCVFYILLMVVMLTLDAIFKIALYEYASTGSVPQGFSSELIQNSVQSK